MRNISFMLTTDQIRRRTKTVTRRLGWRHLTPGTLLQGCVKCMGLKAGESIERLAVVRVLSVTPEPLQALIDDPDYGQAEAIREGFPDMTGNEFVAMFCRSQKCEPATVVNRIEFEYVDELSGAGGPGSGERTLFA